MGNRERPERIALFIDLENFVGFCLGLGLPIDLSSEFARLTELGKVSVRRSYGDIYKLPISNVQKLELRKMLQNNLIQHEDIPYQNEYKNSADIRLVIDALSTVYSNEDIDIVAVVASDRDYLPLFAKLREIGKEIIGIGGSRDNTPELYVKSCDYFFYHEVLSGRGPSTVPSTMMLEATDKSKSEPVSANASVESTDVVKSQPADEFAETENHGEEALKLLVEALKALEATGNSLNSGSSVIAMMRRLKADFEYNAYGYKSFKQLCERASTEGLVDIHQSGVTFNLRLREVAENSSDISITAQIQCEQAQEGGQEKLKKWFENKIRLSLPAHKNRKNVYLQLLLILKNFDPGEGIHLNVLTDRVMEGIKEFNYSQAVCYKLLYSLYRANCFLCTQGPTVNNPVIHALRIPDADYNYLDNKFIENALRLFKRECRSDIDPIAWSEVFFGTTTQVQRIVEISRAL